MKEGKRLTLLLGLVTAWVFCPVTFAQYAFDVPLGDFTQQVSFGDDWGEADYNSYANGTYEILASGNDIWNNSDGFFFVCKEFTGSFVMTADLSWGDQDIPGGGPTAGNEWKKLGLMLRESIEDAGSRHAMGILRNDLGADFQWRTTTGGASSDSGLLGKTATDTDTIQLIRSGNTFTMMRGTTSGSFRQIGTVELADFPETAWLGLCVTAHDTANLERGIFKNVVIKGVSVGASVTRTLPSKVIDAGDSLTGIELAVAIEAGKTSDVTITETIPAGWTLSNVKASIGTATSANGIITWTIPKATGSDAKLTYDVKSSSVIGEFGFSGSIKTSSDEFFTGGGALVNVLPSSTTLGIFEDHQDIFGTEATLGAEGDARYDDSTGTYIVLGSGHDIWDAADDFHFIYMKVTGDCSMKAHVQLEAGDSGSTWAKAGIMLRDELEAGSPHAFAMIRLDGRDFAPQWRDTWGAGGNWEGDPALIEGGTGAGQQSGTIELEYTVADNMVNFNYYDAATGEKVTWRQMDSIDLIDDNYLGFCVTSHQAGAISKGIFTNVSAVIGGQAVGVSEWFLY